MIKRFALYDYDDCTLLPLTYESAKAAEDDIDPALSNIIVVAFDDGSAAPDEQEQEEEEADHPYRHFYSRDTCPHCHSSLLAERSVELRFQVTGTRGWTTAWSKLKSLSLDDSSVVYELQDVGKVLARGWHVSTICGHCFNSLNDLSVLVDRTSIQENDDHE